MTLTAKSLEPISVRKHEPTGVTVHFRKLGHMQRSQLAAQTLGDFGLLLGELARPGVGVAKWEGVEREIRVGEGVTKAVLPYSVEALDQAAEADPDFGAWFNNQLLDVQGLMAEADEETAEGKSGAAASGSARGSSTRKRKRR